MPEKYLYEYAVIRIVPKVEREEFINAGIILFCKRAKYLAVQYALDSEKILLFDKEADVEVFEQNLASFVKVCNGTHGGRIGAMDLADRFRWLTAVRSSCIQTSRPHPGFSNNLEETLNQLFEGLVS